MYILLCLQDRAFCLGPAVMCQILRSLDLRGTVVQTHIVSPRATAYLANVLSENEKIDTLIAFGAGDRWGSLYEYLGFKHWILFKFKCSDRVFYLRLCPSCHLVHKKYQKMIKHFGHWICFSSLRERVASYVLKLVGQKDLLSVTGAEKRNNYNSGFNCFEQRGGLKNF